MGRRYEEVGAEAPGPQGPRLQHISHICQLCAAPEGNCSYVWERGALEGYYTVSTALYCTSGATHNLLTGNDTSAVMEGNMQYM